MNAFMETMKDAASDFWDWHSEVILFFGIIILVIGLFSGGVYALMVHVQQREQENIALCMSAYHYSHDRCLFIVRANGRDPGMQGDER